MVVTNHYHSRGGSRIFLGGGALVSCSTSTPINHIVFFLAEYQLYKKTAGHLGWGGTHPLHPPPRSAPVMQSHSQMAVSVVTTIAREDKEGFTGSVKEDGPVGPLAPSLGDISYLRFKNL